VVGFVDKMVVVLVVLQWIFTCYPFIIFVRYYNQINSIKKYATSITIRQRWTRC
jgi:hypothetical protein